MLKLDAELVKILSKHSNIKPETYLEMSNEQKEKESDDISDNISDDKKNIIKNIEDILIETFIDCIDDEIEIAVEELADNIVTEIKDLAQIFLDEASNKNKNNIEIYQERIYELFQEISKLLADLKF